MYRYFHLVVLGLFSVAAMPYPMRAEFRAGSLPNCNFATTTNLCLSIGGKNCELTYVVCEGGDTNNAINCNDGDGNQAKGCDDTADCGIEYNASRDNNCKTN